MNLSLSIHPPRWLIAFLAVGMLLVAADLALRTRSSAQPAGQPAQMKPRPAPPIAANRFPPPDPRGKSFSLDCGCRVDYSDGSSPPCRIWHKDGGVTTFDHLYRASSTPKRSLGGGVMQLSYDEQDRVTYARYDPESAVYYFNEDGSLKEIRHSIHGGRAEVLHPKYTIEKGVRTRYPHKLPHPHVPADSAMGHVLAGTWKPYERESTPAPTPKAVAPNGSMTLACGCVVEYDDKSSSPCSIRGSKGIISYDHLYRPEMVILPGHPMAQVQQLRYDEQDRLRYARDDVSETMYHFNDDGSMKEIRHHRFGAARAEALPPASKIYRGVRTRRPDQLPHPHIPADSAMGHVIAGNWKPFEK